MWRDRKQFNVMLLKIRFNSIFRLHVYFLHGIYTLYDWSPHNNNPLSLFENKQRSFSNISYSILYIFYNIWGHYNRFVSSYPLINGFCQYYWHIGVNRDWRECKDRDCRDCSSLESLISLIFVLLTCSKLFSEGVIYQQSANIAQSICIFASFN